MLFWRTYNNKLYSVKEVDKLGFPINDPHYIPQEYLDRNEFIILRTCFGLGDWGIISALPRKLKENYPNCKVFLPSEKLLISLFDSLSDNWDSWSKPFLVSETIFKNNPFVDGFINSFEGEIFNDHFRIYDPSKENSEPLVEQILKFWQVENLEDSCPELYFSEEEEQFANSIIQNHTDGRFGTLLISNRFDGIGIEKIQKKLDEYNLPIFYWTNKPETGLKFNKCLDLRHVDTRIQLLIKTKAVFNVGNQTGVNDTVARYAPTYSIPRGNLGSNYIRCQHYI